MKILKITLIVFLLSFSAHAQKRTYEIGFLFDELTPEVLPLLNQLKKEISTVVGEDANISFSSRNQYETKFNYQNAKKSYSKLVSDVDIIISFGVYNSVLINEQSVHPVPTLVVDAFTSKVSGINPDKKTSNKHNLTYIVFSNSFEKDFEQYKKIVDFKNVGIVVEKPLLEVLNFEKIFKESLKGFDSDFKIISYNTANDIINNIDGIDSIYFAGGFLLEENDIKRIADELVAKKIPSFSAVKKSHVDNGIMAASITEDNFDQFFRRIALTIESYVNGTNFSDIPVFIDFNNVLSLNFNTARAIGVPLRYSFIGDTNFIGDIDKNPSAQIVYDLPSVINNVLTNNLTLKSSFKNVDISKQDVKIAKSDYLPSLSISANSNYVDPDLAEVSSGQSPEFSTTGIISLQQTVFSEESNANISIQKSLAKAQKEGFNTDVLDTIFTASNAYFNILILKSNISIQLRNLALTNKNLEIAEENFEVGQAGKSDMLRFRSEKSQNTQSLVEAINELEKGFITLNQLLNNPMNLKIDVKNASLNNEIFKNYNYDFFIKFLDSSEQNEYFVEFLVGEALNNAPELKQLNYNLKAVERRIKLFKRLRYMPLVSLEGQYNNEFDRSGKGTSQFLDIPDDSYNVLLNISFPIFNRNLNILNKQRSTLQKRQIIFDTKNTELSVSSNVRNSVLDLVNQISNIELSAISEEAAKEALELTQTSYSNGAVTIVQLLDAQNNYLDAQLAKSNAIYNYLITMLQLERSIGYYFLLNSEQDNSEFENRFLKFMKNKNNNEGNHDY